MRPLSWLFAGFMRHFRQRSLEEKARFIQRYRHGEADGLLRRILDHAAERVPYYSGLRAGAALQDFPILTKETIRREFARLRAPDWAERLPYENASGGSTGQPVKFLQDEEYRLWALAAELHWLKAFRGVDYTTTSKVILWGSDKDFDKVRSTFKRRLSDWLSNTVFLNTFELTPALLEEYIGAVNRLRPDWVKGYAGSLYQVALFAEKQKMPLHSPRFLFSSAEMLQPRMRETIERAWGCRVFDYYGSREVGAIAAECDSSRMHVFSFNTAVEVVDASGQPVRPGEEGRVLVTTLHNFSMPLIRFDIGDLATPAADPCACGSDLPSLERIHGRVTDHFTTRQGSLVHGEYFTHLFYFVDWIAEFQVVQEDYDRIRISYVPAGQPQEQAMRRIEEGIRERMGPCEIEWLEVPSMPVTLHGKRLFTRSLVTGGAAPAGRRL